MPFRISSGTNRPSLRCKSAVAHQRLAHAYLFHGEDAIGKRTTAYVLRAGPELRTLSAQRTGSTPVVSCRSCQQIEARTHPDYFVIEPDP